jgi:hypothetical protein
MARPQPEATAVLSVQQEEALRCLVHGELDGQSIAPSAWTVTVRAGATTSTRRSADTDDGEGRIASDGRIRLVDSTSEEDRAIDRIDARKVIDRCTATLAKIGKPYASVLRAIYEVEALPLETQSTLRPLGDLALVATGTEAFAAYRAGKPGSVSVVLRSLATGATKRAAKARAAALLEASRLRGEAEAAFVAAW